jgi:ElaB/YqjD/DUF883 family membrane-anchored ribosome-binding protein
MDKEVDQLLNAEQEVQKLLKELQELQKQVGGYDSARHGLEEVRQSLDGFIEKTSVLAVETHSATTLLGKIGTPEILARAESILQALGRLATESAKQVKSTRDLVVATLLVAIISLLASLAIFVKLTGH